MKKKEMKKKGFVLDPLVLLIIIIAAILAFVLFTASPSYSMFIAKYGMLALALIVGAGVGFYSNSFRMFGNVIFNIVLLTFYGLFRLFLHTWDLIDNPYVGWIYKPIAVTFVIGYALGTFFGKLAAG